MCQCCWAGVFALDEFIVFVDEDAEVSKGAASRRRHLQPSKITTTCGMQYDFLPEVLGKKAGRNAFWGGGASLASQLRSTVH